MALLGPYGSNSDGKGEDSTILLQTQTSEMLRIKFMPQERSQDDTGSLQNLNTATLPAWERRNGPNSDF